MNEQPSSKRRTQLHIGRRFEPAKALRVGTKLRHNKLERRIQRRRAFRAASRIERDLTDSWRRNLDVSRLATNSHEAARYIRAAKQEKGTDSNE